MDVELRFLRLVTKSEGEGRNQKFRRVSSGCSRRLSEGASSRSVVDWKEMGYCDLCYRSNREDGT